MGHNSAAVGGEAVLRLAQLGENLEVEAKNVS